jgi:hypothetical protein
VKRGLIAWDKAELPPEVFESRLARARQRLAERDLPALIVYSDLSKSNYARFYSNFMPYFNRALLVIPRPAERRVKEAERRITEEDKPFLLCGLSPRVYPWIKSLTILEKIIASPNLAAKLLEVCAQRGWRRLGFLDPEGLPYDLHRAITAAIQIEAVPHQGDDYERAMHRQARKMAWKGLNSELPSGVGMLDYEFVGRLERKLRRAGAEDLVILVTNGETAPAAAKGQILREGFSVSLALEYRGHWAKIGRFHGVQDGAMAHGARLEVLSGPVPFTLCETPPESAALATTMELRNGGRRFFFADTQWRMAGGTEPL